uniref:DNA helicase n=1 Tax=Acrobeloides nanus TaxID=290746 RepID=A0A914EN98_9BILA
MLEGEIKTCKSTKPIPMNPMDILNTRSNLRTLNSTGLPPHEFKLKKMLLHNLDSAPGLYNGIRLIVKQLHNNFLKCEILTGDNRDDHVFIPRISCTTEEGHFPFILPRRQCPVKPCYAMTINKSQGQTLDYVGIDLTDEVFSHTLHFREPNHETESRYL